MPATADVKYGVSIILVFTGMKLAGLAVGWYIPTPESITVIGVVLAVSILVSLFFSGRKPARQG